MKTQILFLSGILLASFALGAAPSLTAFTFTVDQERYIRKYKEIAISEMERSGVPASIKLAQGILESGSGDSYLARTANNHFGIKCGANWNGDKVFRKDDDYDDRGQLVKSCFRQYRNSEASFVAHSEFLRDPKKSFRYGFLFRLNPTDYRAWANGLRKAGYATNPRYPELLISIIERYNLSQYDSPGAVDPVDVETPTEELITGILRTNDVSYFVSEAPMSVADVARQVEISVGRLLEYNEGLSNENNQVNNQDRVYLQKKRRSYRGKESYHVVLPGENLYEVAQRYALRLDALARRNRLEESDDPATGQKIKLRGGRVKEAPRLEGAIDPNAPVPGTPTVPLRNDGTLDMDEPDTDLNEDPFSGGRPLVIPPATTDPIRLPPTSTVPPRGNPNPNPTPPNTTVTPPTTTPTTDPGIQPAVYHSVAAGDTLYAISRKFNVTVDEIKRLNGLNSNIIAIGQRLRIQ